MTRFAKVVTILGALAMAAIWASPVRAQAADEKEKAPVYTYVAEWGVPRADWAAFEKPDPAFNTLMDKLLADGTIISHGSFKSVMHQDGETNHGGWWSATSMGNVMKALAAVAAQKGPADIEKIQAASKHSDYILVSRQYGSKSGKFENGYLRVGTFKAKPGESEAADKVLKSYIVPMLDKLLGDGAIHMYSIDREAIHSADPGHFFIVVVANGADGLDKFSAALEAAGKANPTGGPAFGAATEGAAHRDSLSLASGAYK